MSSPTLILDRELDDAGFDSKFKEHLYRHGMDCLPNTYTVLDIETTGVSPSEDEILQVGFLSCINGEVAFNNSIFIQTDDDILDAYDNSSYVRNKIANGETDYVKSADVRALGQPRQAALNSIISLIRHTLALDKTSIMLGHNAIQFDLPFLEVAFLKYADKFTFDVSRWFDTGAFVKAIKIKATPYEYESIYEWSLRVREIRAKGVFWNLAAAYKDACSDSTDRIITAHDAANDCYMTHIVYQNIRNRICGN